jgi:hypothetical protein
LTPLDEVPLERIEAELISWAGHLAAATARWLAWLAVYDRRQGWGQWGCRSAAHWLAWKCGMSLRTGRDHVRVARALESLPVIAASFAGGELSFSKVRALTRFPGPIDEHAMLDLARTATASQLDRVVAGCRRALSGDDECEDPDQAWRCRRYHTSNRGDGTVEITLVVPVDTAKRIETAVEQRFDDLVARLTGGGEAGSVGDHVKALGGWPAVRADAASELLTGLGDTPGPDPAEVAIEVDITALAAEPSNPHAHTDTAGHAGIGGDWLSREVIRRYACDAITRVIINNHDHQPLGVGRRQRIVPRWLRRRLERRDHHHCQFPACTNTRRLHAHHITHWANGGPTNLDNLLLLCSYHHHLVHEGGWTLTGPAGNHHLTRPDGTPATTPHLTGNPKPIAETPTNTPNALTALWTGEHLNLAYAVSTTIEHNRHHTKHTNTN